MDIKLKIIIVNIFCISALYEVQAMQEQHKDGILTVVNQHSDEIIKINKNLSDLVSNFNNFVKFTNELVPIGAIMEYSGTAVVPNNWLECDGRAIIRTDYIELLGVIGVTYGIGDALNTFNIPDRRGRVAVGIDSNNSTNGRVTNVTAPNIALGKEFGKETHQLTKDELPQHHHNLPIFPKGDRGGHPTGYDKELNSNQCYKSDEAGGDQPHNNMQPSIFMKFYIRAK